MSGEDRYSIAEFAKRYKVAEAELGRLCEAVGLMPDTILTRDEFKGMLEEFYQKQSQPPQPTPHPSEGTKSPAVGKEDQVKKEKKVPLSRLAAERGLTHPRVAVLENAMGWKDDTKITEAEFQAAINKHLLNKE